MIMILIGFINLQIKGKKKKKCWNMKEKKRKNLKKNKKPYKSSKN